MMLDEPLHFVPTMSTTQDAFPLFQCKSYLSESPPVFFASLKSSLAISQNHSRTVTAGHKASGSSHEQQNMRNNLCMTTRFVACVNVILFKLRPAPSLETVPEKNRACRKKSITCHLFQSGINESHRTQIDG